MLSSLSLSPIFLKIFICRIVCKWCREFADAQYTILIVLIHNRFDIICKRCAIKLYTYKKNIKKSSFHIFLFFLAHDGLWHNGKDDVENKTEIILHVFTKWKKSWKIWIFSTEQFRNHFHVISEIEARHKSNQNLCEPDLIGHKLSFGRFTYISAMGLPSCQNQSVLEICKKRKYFGTKSNVGLPRCRWSDIGTRLVICEWEVGATLQKK